ncbi:hypothetical protein JQX13_45680 [Archangium violaceum]|uniref:hypothetical protein n=1 Tax=Archangium violaceum TaxID=83451 RepID=UPI00193B01DE|nr:hypothetical protein [Archangium violaceum]QRK07261.1 hypothetical protein JQX13_45680 [Archangium violaceum]
MNQNGHQPSQLNGQIDSRVRYILFTGKVKHGHLLRYLLATQGRKRLLETYGLRRQVKSSALTGDPDHVFEVYYADEPERLIRDSDQPLALDGMMNEEDAAQYLALQEIIDAERLPAREVLDPSSPEIPHMRTLLQMPYLLEQKSQEEVSRDLATAPYLLNDICVLKKEDGEDPVSRLTRFTDYVSQIIPTFAQSGFSLLVAGQFESHPDWILNIWQLENLEQHRELMLRLADNRVYSEIDKLCNQEQHLCRNVSRFYQYHPFLMTA